MTSLERFVEIDATPVTDADGIICSGQFLDHGTADRVADFSDEDFSDGLVFAENFKGHAGLHTILGTKGEDGDAEFTFHADDASVLQITDGLTILTTSGFGKSGISLSDGLIETVSGSRISIRSAFHQAHAGLGEFNQSVSEFIALIFHDSQVAEGSEQALLGLILGVFESADAETFEQTSQLFVAVFKFAGFSIGSSGALSQGVVLVLSGKKLSVLGLKLGSGDSQCDVQFLVFEFVIRTQACHTHCEKQGKGSAGDGSAE